jgi:hypothetical protein
MYLGWTVMAVYVNLNAGVGKPLWEITLGEFTVWFKVRDSDDRAHGFAQQLIHLGHRRLCVAVSCHVG